MFIERKIYILMNFIILFKIFILLFLHYHQQNIVRNKSFILLIGIGFKILEANLI
jgi:hypothetical protein